MTDKDLEWERKKESKKKERKKENTWDKKEFKKKERKKERKKASKQASKKENVCDKKEKLMKILENIFLSCCIFNMEALVACGFLLREIESTLSSNPKRGYLHFTKY